MPRETPIETLKYLISIMCIYGSTCIYNYILFTQNKMKAKRKGKLDGVSCKLAD